MRSSISSWIVLVVSITAVAACEQATGGGGSGPPHVLQVLVRERVPGMDDMGNPVMALVPRIAFGDHPDIPGPSPNHPDGDDRDVTAAVARDGQRIRVVVDELLRGNELEEVACADGTWSRVPTGATFDDVARCAGANLDRCNGICIGASGPVGILDKDHDGQFDDSRLIEGAVVLTCDGAAVPVDVGRSFYQPSGTQLIASSGIESLGPAIVITPAAGMRPGSACGVAFAPAVVDKHDLPLCAPTAAGCTPGDTSAVHFQVEPFLLATSDPPSGATDVALTAPMSTDAVISLQLNADLDPATVAAAITVTADAVPVAGLTPVVSADDAATITITIPGGFTSGTAYQVKVAGGAAGPHDTFADTLAQDASITWTTK